MCVVFFVFCLSSIRALCVRFYCSESGLWLIFKKIWFQLEPNCVWVKLIYCISENMQCDLNIHSIFSVIYHYIEWETISEKKSVDFIKIISTTIPCIESHILSVLLIRNGKRIALTCKRSDIPKEPNLSMVLFSCAMDTRHTCGIEIEGDKQKHLWIDYDLCSSYNNRIDNNSNNSNYKCMTHNNENMCAFWTQQQRSFSMKTHQHKAYTWIRFGWHIVNVLTLFNSLHINRKMSVFC